MKGKPKWFIFQSCRGDLHDQGTSANGQNGNQIDASRIEECEKPNTVPSWQDILILFATIPNQVSYRDIGEGTILIYYLDKVFREVAHCLDLKELLDVVSSQIAMYQSSGGGKQMCVYDVRGFSKKLYFKPRFVPSTPIPGSCREIRRNVGTDYTKENCGT